MCLWRFMSALQLLSCHPVGGNQGPESRGSGLSQTVSMRLGNLACEKTLKYWLVLVVDCVWQRVIHLTFSRALPIKR